uniref:CD28 molecule n=1 Tax=Crocodylus porosus TaxID=8502 RepID=A0A7M4E065_CROPO
EFLSHCSKPEVTYFGHEKLPPIERKLRLCRNRHLFRHPQWCTENKILVTQRPVLRVDNKTATLVCNYTYNGTGKEFRASLHKGTDSAVEVCFVSWNITKGNNTQSTNGFTCHGYQDDQKKHVIFSLSNMNPNHTDIYFCKIEVMYPPPYVCSDKSNGTIIHVRDVPFQQSELQSTRYFWLMAAAIGVFAIYSIIITVACIHCSLKNKKNRILQSDYMNMTPRHPQGPKNKCYQPYAPTRDYTAYRSWQP